jgi:formate-dependent nitrite reductase cytochrome c552 subunit
MPKLKEKKQKFLNEVVPQWIEKAKKEGKLIEL